VIPTPVVEHFLTDYERNNAFTGFPMLGLSWQTTESPALRKVMKMQDNQSGVLVRDKLPTAPAAAVLEIDDIITHFEGVRVANDGTVPFRRGERIAFGYLVSQKYHGEMVNISILRNGIPMDLQVQLSKPTNMVPSHLNGNDPSYFILAGLVFISASEPYLLSEFGSEYLFAAPIGLLHILSEGKAEEEGEQVVVLSQVLAADVNLGYESINNSVVSTFNGVKIKSLKQLADLAETCTEPYMKLELLGNELVVLQTDLAQSETPAILETHAIPRAKSIDLMRTPETTDESTRTEFNLDPENPDAALDEMAFLDASI